MSMPTAIALINKNNPVDVVMMDIGSHGFPNEINLCQLLEVLTSKKYDDLINEFTSPHTAPIDENGEPNDIEINIPDDLFLEISKITGNRIDEVVKKWLKTDDIVFYKMSEDIVMEIFLELIEISRKAILENRLGKLIISF